MIMSLKAASLGLNMVAACHVILLDLWWNPTTEDQAIDRAHRIGQTRPVTVSRLTVKDTVEDRILALQVFFFLLSFLGSVLLKWVKNIGSSKVRLLTCILDLSLQNNLGISGTKGLFDTRICLGRTAQLK